MANIDANSPPLLRGTLGKRKEDEKGNHTSKRLKNAVDRTHPYWTMELPMLTSSGGSCHLSLRHEESISRLTFPQVLQGEKKTNSDSEFAVRVNEALNAAADKPFAKEDLKDGFIFGVWLCQKLSPRASRLWHNR
jgi:hypothetical protein